MLRWFGQRKRFEHVPDTFTQRRVQIVNAIIDIARKEAGKRRLTLLLSHFPEAFAELQLAFDCVNAKYTMLDGEDPEGQLQQIVFEQLQQPVLGWSGSFLSAGELESDRWDIPMSIIVIERHPRVEFDVTLRRYFRRLSNDVRIGWYLSFEDPVVNACIGQNGIDLMKLLGMKFNDVITSEMLGARINRVLKSKNRKCDPNLEFKSAKHWVDTVSQ